MVSQGVKTVWDGRPYFFSRQVVHENRMRFLFLCWSDLSSSLPLKAVGGVSIVSGLVFSMQLVTAQHLMCQKPRVGANSGNMCKSWKDRVREVMCARALEE